MKLLTSVPGMSELIPQVRKAVANGATILIEAERGCGAARLARFIHGEGPGADGPFVGLHCAAIQGDLLESGFLGRAFGAFSEAPWSPQGAVETAASGTIYLRDVGDMSLALQAILLRVLQAREGEKGRHPAGVGIIASTHSDLEAAVRTGRFREGLYSRLHVLRIPPLRERPRDIPFLVERLCAHDDPAWGSFRVSAGALAALQAHTWPGNIRELDRTVRRAMSLANGPDLEAIDFFPEGALPVSRGILLTPGPEISCCSTREVERSFIEDALSRTGGNRTRAAAIVGISVRTLRNKLRSYRNSDGAGGLFQGPRKPA